jgi:hypothetical protein
MVSKHNQASSLLSVYLATYSSDKSNQQPFTREVSLKTILTGIALVGSGGFFTTLAYVQWVASSDENKIKERFNNPITITEDLKYYVPRTDVESSLKKILTADEVNSYWVVSGDHGIGKTTTVQKVCNEIGKGIIYVDVPKDVANFGKAFAQAIGVYYHQQDDGIFSHIHNLVFGPEEGIIVNFILELTWKYAYKQFKTYADWYRKENNRAPVIVIDNVNRLANGAPKILEIMQEGAKDAVGSGLFTAVFVASNGSVCQMIGNLYFSFQHDIVFPEQIFIALEI